MAPARACARPVVTLLAAVVTLLLLAAAPAVAAPAPAPTEPAAASPAPVEGLPAATARAPEAAPPAAAPAPEVRPLRIGMRGSSVRGLQRELRRRGVRLRADGVFGRATRAAVRRVQMKLGLRVTGVADRALLEELELVAPVAAAAAAPGPAPEGADLATVAAAAGTVAAPEGEPVAPEAEDPGRTDVVEFARTLLGTPYRFAGADPSGFDCSGFVLYVFERFGIEMPRSAHEQFAAFPRVAREDLRPGDVVFFDALGHDGIYIGRDRFIHSSKPGDVVKISRMDVSWYASRYEGAVRPE